MGLVVKYAIIFFVLPIVRAPNPILSQPSQPVKRIDSLILRLVGEMKTTLESTRDPEGVGLAAPQVGKSLRLFIAKPTSKSDMLVFINPEILSKSDALVPLKRPRGSKNKKAGALEGCLSLPTIWGPVLRAPVVELRYLDEKGKSHKKTFKGFLATIIQHEYDHIQGILFPKRVLEQKGKLYKSHKEEGQDAFEEIEI